MKFLSSAALSVAFALTSFTAMAADYPAPKQGDWVLRRISKFHTGDDHAGAAKKLALHHRRRRPTGQPDRWVLHGSGGSARGSMR